VTRTGENLRFTKRRFPLGPYMGVALPIGNKKEKSGKEKKKPRGGKGAGVLRT